MSIIIAIALVIFFMSNDTKIKIGAIGVATLLSLICLSVYTIPFGIAFVMLAGKNVNKQAN